jgi:polyketide biosynthesis enoyl-CoA hydratase PksH
MSYQTIQVRFQEPICFIQFYRPEANNTINDLLIKECLQVLELCEESITVVVLEGVSEVFCFGADFQEIHQKIVTGEQSVQNPEPLYRLWLKLATGPYVTISHVRGKANAGGVGFVAASDIVLADQTAQFSLSELLFGLFPACVLPFLIRRTGFQKARYMTLMTQPILVQQAHSWGLVDAYDVQSESLLRKHLLRLKRLSKKGILRYKRYMSSLDALQQSKPLALAANQEVFSDHQNLEWIYRFVDQGKFPWED